jgi:hypothetical protein
MLADLTENVPYSIFIIVNTVLANERKISSKKIERKDAMNCLSMHGCSNL